MANLIRTLLIFLVVYYLFKFIAKYLLPFFVSNRLEKMKRDQEHAQSNYMKKKRAEEGKVTIQYASEKEKRDTSEGEYVDYEEVK